MTEFTQFAMNNITLFGAWTVVAALLLIVQFRIMAHGPKSITSQMLTNYVNREDAVVIDIRGQGKQHLRQYPPFFGHKHGHSSSDLMIFNL